MDRIDIGFYSELNTGTGIGNYETELYKSIQKQPDVNIEVVSPVSYSTPIIGDYLSYTAGVRRTLSNLENEYDIVHLPSQLQAAGLLGVNMNLEIVVSVHDIIPYASPQYGNILSRNFSKLYIKGLNKARHIISISEHTKKDLIQHTAIEKEKVTIVKPAIDPSIFSNPASKKILEKYDITKPYLLYVGTQGSKKNLETILAALQEVNTPPSLDFAIVGGPGNRLQSTRTNIFAKKFGISDQVVQTGHVSVDELARLYRSAFVFVFPSKYEGFGRPPLEAMSVGTPVIASTVTAVPEVVNNAAIQCDPDDSAEWANAITSLRDNDDIRQSLIQRGYDRVEEFSWKKTTKEMVNVYKSMI